ncbi:hypothetical protein LCGC14_1490620 [marine sediment metagenome]|uniref:Macro domain-containing protein n=1 Tax=marine sediment metagenome TaxID=412755 RepID=A0A0F9M8L3_9ZZZZ
MKTIDGNILDIDNGIICHQVNCKGVMGAGLALQIKNKWPEAYDGYMTAYRGKYWCLGEILPVLVSDDLCILHMAAQKEYGREPGKIYTNYMALATCMIKANDFAKAVDRPVYLPYGIGCGLAGAEWKTVSEMIDKFMPSAVVVRLGQKGG